MEKEFNKKQPQAVDLEKAILGAIMIEPICLPEVSNLLFDDVFYIDAHKIIFRAIMSLYDANRSIDILTVVDELIKNKKLDDIGGAYYVAGLINDVSSSANIEEHCKIVLEKYLKRSAIGIGFNLLKDAYDDTKDAFEIYDKADNEIINTQERVLNGSIKDINFYCSKVYEQYETVKETGVLGLMTNIKPIDAILKGLVAPDLFVVAARPSQGKTAFC